MDRVGNVELSALREEAMILVHHGMPRGISIELLEEMWQARPIVSGRSAVAFAFLARYDNAALAQYAARRKSRTGEFAIRTRRELHAHILLPDL